MRYVSPAMPTARQLPMSLANIPARAQAASNGHYAAAVGGIPGSIAAGVQPLSGNAALAGSTGNAEESREAMQAVVDALSVCSAQAADPPQDSMVVPLLKHQRLALGWMLSREGATTGKKALCPDGGLLADDQVNHATVSTVFPFIPHPTLGHPKAAVTSSAFMCTYTSRFNTPHKNTMHRYSCR